MPAADPIQFCRNPFCDEQGNLLLPKEIHPLAQIELANGSLLEAYYNSESKMIIIERNNVYYECPRYLTIMDILNAITGLLDNECQLSNRCSVDMGEIDYDTVLFTSCKRLRRRHRALQLVFV